MGEIIGLKGAGKGTRGLKDLHDRLRHPKGSPFPVTIDLSEGAFSLFLFASGGDDSVANDKVSVSISEAEKEGKERKPLVAIRFDQERWKEFREKVEAHFRGLRQTSPEE